MAIKSNNEQGGRLELGEGYDVEAFCSFLEKVGFAITIRTLQRYCKLGIVSLPFRQRIFTNQDLRVCYHPFSIIEAMTAILLFKGDWLTVGSTKRNARLTQQDIFIGRIAFLSDGGAQWLKDECIENNIVRFDEFSITSEEYYVFQSDFECFPTNPKNADMDMMECHQLNIKMVEPNFMGADDMAAYINCMEMYYRTTFLNLYKQFYKKIVEGIPLKVSQPKYTILTAENLVNLGLPSIPAEKWEEDDTEEIPIPPEIIRLDERAAVFKRFVSDDE